MTSNCPLKQRFYGIIKEGLTIPATQRGFQRRSLEFSRPHGDVLQMIGVEHSQWNTSRKIEFTLNCGVYIEGVISAFGSPPPPRPRLLDCCLSARPGLITPPYLDPLLLLSDESSDNTDSTIITYLSSAFHSVILPFFDRFSSSRRIAEFLSVSTTEKPDKFLMPRADVMRFAYAAIIWDKIGETERCRESMEMAVNASKKSPYPEPILTLAKKYGL